MTKVLITAAVSAVLTGAIGYTSELTKYLIEHSEESQAIQAQLDHPGVDIFTGLPFKENPGNLTDEEKQLIDLNFDYFSRQIINYRLEGYTYLEIAKILNINIKELLN